MNRARPTHVLAESFSILANEVQALIDRKTVLEHKLRYAHEKVHRRTPSTAELCPFVHFMMISLALDLQPSSLEGLMADGDNLYPI